MIRIDEIYNNTFWPWIQEHLKNKRVFFCDPPGHTSPDNLFNLGIDSYEENGYLFIHDQEPVHIDIYKPLFDEVIVRNGDLIDKIIFTKAFDYYPNHFKFQNPTFKLPKFGGIITSEYNSEFVDELCDHYGWTPYYYFYHGWACLDWFRGYDKTFLLKPVNDRKPTRTFMSPNRIVGGHRDHRLLFGYNLIKHNLLESNHVSFPRVCPEENIDVGVLADRFKRIYLDIHKTFDSASLPKLFNEETTQVMSSCWLTNFKEAEDSMFYVPTETVFFGRRSHITEKTFKAIAMCMPFILVAPAHSLEYLRSYGFETFGDIIDESYDTEEDDIRRIEKVTQLLAEIESKTAREKEEIFRACSVIAKRNYDHFYKGAFEDILWNELLDMLDQIKEDYAS